MAEIRNLTRNGETFYPLTHEKAVIGMDEFKETITEQVENYKPIEITGNVTNAPDEEDITADSNNLLKFKNRNNLYGLGKVILRRDKTFSAQVTLANTIYVVQYNFDLNNGRVVLPLGAILLFEGGSVNNGTLVGNGNRLVYYQELNEIMTDLTLEGTFVYKACDKDTIGSISVDNSSIEENELGQLSVKANGIQNTHLNGNVVDQIGLVLDSNNKISLKDGGVTNSKLDSSTVDNSSVSLDTNNKISIKDGGVTGNKLNSGIVNTDDLSIVNNKIQLSNRDTTDGMGKIILRKDQSFASQLTQTNTIYVIRYDYTLTSDVTVPDNCVLEFDGGSISGAYTLTGNNTGLENLTYTVFKGISLSGTFKKNNIINDYVFSSYEDDAELFMFMSLVGNNIHLSDGSRYTIIKKNTTITVDSIFADNNAYLDFIVDVNDYTAAGIGFYNIKQLCLKNLTISENYDEHDTNAHTVGCTFVISNTSNTKTIINVSNCTFTGIYYSSCIACSGAKEINVDSCVFDNVKAYDHFVYCSTNIKSYKIYNCSLNDAYSRAGAFKIRDTSNCIISFCNIKSSDYTGYFTILAGLSFANINFTNIDVKSTINGNNGQFADLSGNDINIKIVSSKIEVISPGNQLFRQISACSNINVNIVDSYIMTRHIISTSGSLSVYNSHLIFKGAFTVVYDISFRYYNSTIESNLDNGECICKLYNSTFKDFIFINSKLLGTSSCVISGSFPSDYEDTANVLIVNSSINAAHNLCYTGTAIRYKATVINNEFKGTAWPEWYGACAPINVDFGTTRPTLTSKDKNFMFFDTSSSINKPIWWNGTAWVDATGNSV